MRKILTQSSGVVDRESLLLRGSEVAEALGISRSLAYQLMASNTLPVVRVPGGRSVRVPRSALLRWIESQTAGGQGVAA